MTGIKRNTETEKRYKRKTDGWSMDILKILHNNGLKEEKFITYEWKIKENIHVDNYIII